MDCIVIRAQDYFAGNSTTKVLPLPFPSLSAQILPSWALTICFATYSPNPVPLTLIPEAPRARTNFSNNPPISSASMPTPESDTSPRFLLACSRIPRQLYCWVVYLLKYKVYLYTRLFVYINILYEKDMN